MGALPKKKVTRHARGNRRLHQKLAAPHLIACPSCGKLMQLHRVCKACGVYRDRQVVRLDDDNS